MKFPFVRKKDSTDPAKGSGAILDHLTSIAFGQRLEHVHGDDGIPLCVDLDGTFLHTEVGYENVLAQLGRHPLAVFAVFFWTLIGRRRLRTGMARIAALDPATLPYRKDILQLLREEQRRGREIVLVSSAPEALMRAIANHLGLFSDIIAIGPGQPQNSKAMALCARFGAGNFDYLGSNLAHVPVWRTARRCLVIAPSRRLLRQPIWNSVTARLIEPDPVRSRHWIDCVRPAQWFKNLLVFLPVMAARQAPDLHLLVRSYLAFCAFCLLASAGYIVNDLVDLTEDRRHPGKRRRPLATGGVPLSQAAFLFTILSMTGVSLGFFLSPLFGAWAAFYLLLTLAYSFWLKRIFFLDIFVIAALYMQRVVAGDIVAGAEISLWQLALAGYFFLGLAFLTRYGELKALNPSRRRGAEAGHYHGLDINMLVVFGVVSGYLATAVLALYAGNAYAQDFYRSPQLLWLICPLLLYWTTRSWACANRALMRDNPVVFAVRDPASRVIALACLVIFAGAVLLTLPCGRGWCG